MITGINILWKVGNISSETLKAKIFEASETEIPSEAGLLSLANPGPTT